MTFRTEQTGVHRPRTICGVPDGEPSVAVALQRNARVQAHHLLTAPKRNVCNDRQGVPFVARGEQRAPGRKGCAYLWGRATPHGEDTSGDGDISSKSQRGARPHCPFLLPSLFSSFGLQGKGHRFGGGPSSHIRQLRVGLPASWLRVCFGNSSTFLPICSSPKCNICTSNYTLNVTVGENNKDITRSIIPWRISPPLLSKSRVTLRIGIFGCRFYFFESFSPSANNPTSGLHLQLDNMGMILAR